MSDSETDIQPDSGAADAADAAPPAPPYSILFQFLRDLSFENQSTPHVSLAPDVKPTIDVKVDVTGKALQEGVFEVELHMEVRATAQEHKIYTVEVVYVAVVQINAVPSESLEPVLLIEVPRHLFPFARSIIATATQDGGFPSLLLTPFDFVALYQQRVQNRADQSAQAEA